MSTPKSQKSLRGSDLYERALNIKQSTVIDKKGKETVNDEAFLKAVCASQCRRDAVSMLLSDAGKNLW
eukprot:2217333-Rhodomonas_salina.1